MKRIVAVIPKASDPQRKERPGAIMAYIDGESGVTILCVQKGMFIIHVD